MQITSAILSLLSTEELSGYDIKKRIQENIFFPWSGNNNQVYKALSELQEKNLVTSENVTQAKTPTKKVYRILPKGREYLKEYANSEFESMQLSKPFLLRFMSASDLSKEEILNITENYRNQLLVELGKLRECDNRNQIDKNLKNNLSEISQFIIEQVNINAIKSVELELDWLNTLNNELDQIKFNEENTNTFHKGETVDKPLKYTTNEEYLVYSVENNGMDNLATTKVIKDIIIDVVENNYTKLTIEEEIFTKSSFTKEFQELMSFEFKKYNIEVEIK